MDFMVRPGHFGNEVGRVLGGGLAPGCMPVFMILLFGLSFCVYHFSVSEASVHLMFLKHCLWCCFLGSLILIGGDPGIGKSTLLLQVRRCHFSYFFSLQMLVNF